MTARVARCLVALSLCAAGAAGCAGTSGAGTVTIVIPWDNHSAEYNAFQSVIGPWEQRTGVKVDEEISRAPAEQLDIDRATGDIPDLVDMPSPVALDQLLPVLFTKFGWLTLKYISGRHVPLPSLPQLLTVA